MSTDLRPREVERPFLRRWCVAALALLLRAPLSFGLVIAALGTLDTYAGSLGHNYVMPRWSARVLSLSISGLLPVVWVVVAALSRGADRSLGAGVSLEPILRRDLWRGVMFAAVVQIGQDLLGFVLSGVPMSSVPMSKGFGSGLFVATVGTYGALLTLFFGSSCFPLLVQAPGVSARALRGLSCSADELNGYSFMWRERRHFVSICGVFVGCALALALALSSVVPAFGMTNAAFLVFLGVFNYVGYRDIFERRAENAPRVSAPAAASPAANPAVT